MKVLSNIELIMKIMELKQLNKVTDNDILDKFMEVADNNILKQVYAGLINDDSIEEVEF